MDKIRVDDLKLLPEVFAVRLERRARLRDAINAGMPQIDKAGAEDNLNEYYDPALSLIISGRAPEAFDLRRETAESPHLYRRNTLGHNRPRPRPPPAARRRHSPPPPASPPPRSSTTT